jgi:hypothetical protein
LTWSRTILAGAALALVVSVGAGCGGDDDGEQGAVPTATEPGEGTGHSVTIELLEENDSGQSGTATLTDIGLSGTSVVLEVSLSPDAPEEAQPDSINGASCAEVRALGSVEAQDRTVIKVLTEVRDGRSETTSASPLDELTTGGKSINVYEASHPFPPVVCGDIPGR